MEKIALTDLDSVVEEVLAKLPNKKSGATIVALSGNLGAGKTTFTQALGKKLGILETIQSPTYVLMRSYPIVYSHFTMFIHIDAYRLETPEEFKTLKPETFLATPENLVCIEWPEKTEGMLPIPDITLRFSSDGVGEGERYIEII
jgi:tRNA threonylcarbamoyladenosine biosynthesis protein TsaE